MDSGSVACRPFFLSFGLRVLGSFWVVLLSVACSLVVVRFGRWLRFSVALGRPYSASWAVGYRHCDSMGPSGVCLLWLCGMGDMPPSGFGYFREPWTGACFWARGPWLAGCFLCFLAFLGVVVGWIGPDGSVATATATVGGPCLVSPWWDCGAGSGRGLFSFGLGGWFSGLVFGFLGSGCMTTGWMCISTWGFFALCWCPFLGWGIGMPGPSLGAPFLSGNYANGERKDYRPCYMQRWDLVGFFLTW